MPIPRHPEPECLYLSINLISKTDLQPLARAFGSAVFSFNVVRHDDGYHARFEIASAIETAEEAILYFFSLVSRLPAYARRKWDRAFSKIFDISVEAPETPFCHQLVLSPTSMKAASELGVRIIFRICPPPKVSVAQQKDKPAE